jgi:hypothetical protein
MATPYNFEAESARDVVVSRTPSDNGRPGPMYHEVPIVPYRNTEDFSTSKVTLPPRVIQVLLKSEDAVIEPTRVTWRLNFGGTPRLRPGTAVTWQSVSMSPFAGDTTTLYLEGMRVESYCSTDTESGSLVMQAGRTFFNSSLYHFEPVSATLLDLDILQSGIVTLRNSNVLPANAFGQNTQIRVTLKFAEPRATS